MRLRYGGGAEAGKAADIRKGSMRGDMRTIARALHALFRFFNLLSNHQSQTLLIRIYK